MPGYVDELRNYYSSYGGHYSDRSPHALNVGEGDEYDPRPPEERDPHRPTDTPRYEIPAWLTEEGFQQWYVGNDPWDTMGGWHADKWASDAFAGNSRQLDWVRQAYDAWKAETAAAATTTGGDDDDGDDDDDGTGKTYGRLTVEDQAVLKALTSGQSGDFLQIARK